MVAARVKKGKRERECIGQRRGWKMRQYSNVRFNLIDWAYLLLAMLCNYYVRTMVQQRWWIHLFGPLPSQWEDGHIQRNKQVHTTYNWWHWSVKTVNNSSNSLKSNHTTPKTYLGLVATLFDFLSILILIRYSPCILKVYSMQNRQLLEPPRRLNYNVHPFIDNTPFLHHSHHPDFSPYNPTIFSPHHGLFKQSRLKILHLLARMSQTGDGDDGVLSAVVSIQVLSDNEPMNERDDDDPSYHFHYYRMKPAVKAMVPCIESHAA